MYFIKTNEQLMSMFKTIIIRVNWSRHHVIIEKNIIKFKNYLNDSTKITIQIMTRRYRKPFGVDNYLIISIIYFALSRTILQWTIINPLAHIFVNVMFALV